MNSSFKIPALLALCLAAPAFAHVSLQQAQADGGSSYQAVLRVTKLTASPGPLWLKVRQTCGQRRIDWADLPDRGTATEGMKTPAVLLQVRAPAAVKVEQAWVRPSVPGQQGTGGYMLLTARQGLRLVGASSPVAGVAEVHVM